MTRPVRMALSLALMVAIALALVVVLSGGETQRGERCDRASQPAVVRLDGACVNGAWRAR